MSTDPDQNAAHVSQHFSNVAPEYHADWLFHSRSSPHELWLNTLIYGALDLKRGHILADIGCGPGDDCLWFLNKINNEIKIIGCDPASGMIEIFNKEIKKKSLTNMAQAFCMDAVTFSQQKQLPAFNRILMKQCVHLLSQSERLLAFKGFRQQFNSDDNKLVIVTRPGKSSFPFDKRITEMWISQSLPIDNLVKELEMCGFTNIKCDTRDYDLKETYKHKTFQLKDEILILHCTANNH
ncbi:unnamed protein product [Rotaria magnacalcarata]